ncbi:MAG: hypothetical protein LAO22_20245 [Acidobacteriia bacterium]|nr:hypothetical protein [Terriglobia bacterium]
MAKRGKVLRDPHAGPGLLIVEGRQYPFIMEGVWGSEVPPKPGLAVEVEFDSLDKIIGITALPESQIAKEQAEIALAAAKKRGAALAASLAAKFGLPRLVAAGLLIFSWSFLTAASLELPFLGKLEFTLWQALGYLNSGNPMQALERHGNPGSGFWGFLAFAALAGPFLHHFWKDKRAALGGLLPLAFMVLVGIAIRSSMQSSFGAAIEGPYGNLQRQAQDEMMNAFSFGFGTYLSIVVSLYLSVISAKEFLIAVGGEGRKFEESQRSAA